MISENDIKKLLEEASEILGNSMFQYCDTETKARNLSSRIDKSVLKIQSTKEDQ